MQRQPGEEQDMGLCCTYMRSPAYEGVLVGNYSILSGAGIATVQDVHGWHHDFLVHQLQHEDCPGAGPLNLAIHVPVLESPLSTPLAHHNVLQGHHQTR